MKNCIFNVISYSLLFYSALSICRTDSAYTHTHMYVYDVGWTMSCIEIPLNEYQQVEKRGVAWSTS